MYIHVTVVLLVLPVVRMCHCIHGRGIKVNNTLEDMREWTQFIVGL
jgi:hypothetical protein